MTSTLVLTIAASLLDFLLKSSLCFVLVLVLVRLTLSARLRFAAWFAYLVGSLLYALALVTPAIRSLLDAKVVSSVSAPAVANAAAPAVSHALWTLPAAFEPYARLLLIFAGIGYLLTVSIKLTVHLRRRARLRRALLFAYHPAGAIGDLGQLLANELELPATTLLILPGLASPATIGWLHPVVLLPPACEDQPLDQTADILRHEMHHILRRDWLLERIACSIRALLFFQPALLAALRHLRIERELACDQAVLDACPESRLHYAESLLQVARLARQVARGVPENSKRRALELASGIEFAANASQLETRLRAVLAGTHRYPRGMRALIGLTVIVLLISVIAGLPYLTVTLAFTDSIGTLNGLNSAASSSLPTPDPLAAVSPYQAFAARESSKHNSRSNTADPHANTSSMSPDKKASVLSMAPVAPSLRIDSRPQSGIRSTFKLEPTADTEDFVPASDGANSATADERNSPLSATTNLAIKAGSPTHSVVTILADAAVILSRHDADRNDH